MWGRNFGPSGYNPYVGKTDVKPIADFTKLKDFLQNRKNEEELGNRLAEGDYEGARKVYARMNPQGYFDSTQKLNQARETADLQFERQKELANINNAAALERIKQTYANKGGASGFGNTANN